MANLSHLPAAWRASGLSQRAFCEREGVSLATFSYWRTKELQRDRDREREPADVPTFTEVVVEPQSTLASGGARAIEVTYPDGTRVRIPVPAPRAPARC